MAGKRKARYSSRFLAVINPHALPVIWFVASCFRHSASPSSGPATRIGHIGVAAEGLTTGAFNRPIRNVQAAASQSCDGASGIFRCAGTTNGLGSALKRSDIAKSPRHLFIAAVSGWDYVEEKRN
jgi:hypothetical protein